MVAPPCRECSPPATPRFARPASTAGLLFPVRVREGPLKGELVSVWLRHGGCYGPCTTPAMQAHWSTASAAKHGQERQVSVSSRSMLHSPLFGRAIRTAPAGPAGRVGGAGVGKEVLADT